MKILMITTNDPAGVGINFKNAMNKYTSHSARLVTNEIRYNFMYEKDIHIPAIGDFSELKHLLISSDLFHFHMGADENMALGPFKVGDFLDNKKIVHHHHGEPKFRENPRYFAEKEIALGRRAIVATPDLWRFYPEAAWIPNPVPINDERYTPLEKKSRLRVSHSPTKKEIKNTESFVRVTRELCSSFDNLEPIVIENTPHTECLSIKRESSVFFDHMQGYYGVSSLEALSQGVPTIAGIDSWNEYCIKQFTRCDRLPWVIAENEDELRFRLSELLSDDDLRYKTGSESRQWMEKYWTEEKIANKLAEFYESL